MEYFINPTYVVSDTLVYKKWLVKQKNNGHKNFTELSTVKVLTRV